MSDHARANEYALPPNGAEEGRALKEWVRGQHFQEIDCRAPLNYCVGDLYELERDQPPPLLAEKKVTDAEAAGLKLTDRQR